MENQSQKTPSVAPVASAQANAGAAAKPAGAAQAAGTAPVGAASGAQKVVAPQKQPGSRVAGSPKASNDVFVRKIVDKIKSSENILVALSRDPSVDEMAAAIGLTLFLDSLQKHTTAVYSGVTPDALQFLQPEGTFETNTDSLQDFIIALNKEKADHLRYKLDGDFVKVYITPYKSNITEEDLEFSHGDYNVNLVLALGVPSAADLDSALAEHGRIMHDATTVDITIDAPGKFAEIEWSDPGASSVSEMVTKLIFAMQGEDVVLDKETATALLTGIVAATGRFSNDRTNSDTMQLASKLMSMGADQQLISAHVMDNDSGAYSVGAAPRTDLAVAHDDIPVNGGPEIAIQGAVVTPVVEPAQTQMEQAPAVVTQPEQSAEVGQASVSGPSQAELAAAASAAVNEAVAAAAANAAAAGASGAGLASQPAGMTATTNQVAQPQVVQQGMVNPLPAAGERKDYAQMMAQALAEPGIGENSMAAMPSAPVVSTPTVAPAASDSANVGSMTQDAANTAGVNPVAQASGNASTNLAAQAAPAEAVQGPEPVAKPSGVTLPPPPAPVPTADMMPPALPTANTVAGNTGAPAAAGAGNTPTAVTQSDAFQIPGMH